jgi:aspartate/methionine/tyrosine aminotransferase
MSGIPTRWVKNPLRFTDRYWRSAICLENGVDHPSAGQLFPQDVLERAREMRDIVGPPGTGAYTNSQGLVGFRRHVAKYIADRDGHPAFEGDIFLTDGASSAIEMVLNALIAHDTDAIMTPIPQYPIYSALITRLGGRKVVTNWMRVWLGYFQRGVGSAWKKEFLIRLAH